MQPSKLDMKNAWVRSSSGGSKVSHSTWVEKKIYKQKAKLMIELEIKGHRTRRLFAIAQLAAFWFSEGRKKRALTYTESLWWIKTVRDESEIAKENYENHFRWRRTKMHWANKIFWIPNFHPLLHSTQTKAFVFRKRSILMKINTCQRFPTGLGNFLVAAEEEKKSRIPFAPRIKCANTVWLSEASGFSRWHFTSQRALKYSNLMWFLNEDRAA